MCNYPFSEGMHFSLNYTCDHVPSVMTVNDSNSSGVLPVHVPSSSDFLSTQLTFILFMAAIFCLGTSGNLLSLFIYHCRWPRSSFCLCVQCLALLDLLNLLVSFPLLLASRLLGQEGMVLCRLTHGISHASVFSSGLVMLVVAVERYRKVCRSWEASIPPKVARNLCAIAVVVASLASVPYAMSFTSRDITVTWEDGTSSAVLRCHMGDVITGAPWLFVYYGVTGVSLATVTTSLVVLYGRIGCFVLRQRERRPQRPPSTNFLDVIGTPTGTTLRRNTVTITTEAMSQTTKVCFVLTVVFFLSFLPYIGLVIASAQPGFGKMTPGVYTAFQVGWFFPFLNNISNPFVYGFISSKFRKECRKIFQCCFD